MKLSEEALLQIIDILRQGLLEERDISDLLRGLDLSPNNAGKLAPVLATQQVWVEQSSETD